MEGVDYLREKVGNYCMENRDIMSNLWLANKKKAEIWTRTEENMQIVKNNIESIISKHVNCENIELCAITLETRK